MKTNTDISGYHYATASPTHAHGYLLPAVFRLLDRLQLPVDRRRLFELGCGNGSVANELTRRGWDVTGVDPSNEGISQANRCYPDLKLYEGSAYDNLAAKYGQFPVVISLEVVEHVYSPRQYAATLYSLVARGGGRDHFDAISRVLEESGDGGYRKNGRSFYRALGSWTHQVLVI